MRLQKRLRMVWRAESSVPVVQLAGYKVKCMLAEPKGKRGRADSGGGSLDTGPSWQVRISENFLPLD